MGGPELALAELETGCASGLAFSPQQTYVFSPSLSHIGRKPRAFPLCFGFMFLWAQFCAISHEKSTLIKPDWARLASSFAHFTSKHRVFPICFGFVLFWGRFLLCLSLESSKHAHSALNHAKLELLLRRSSRLSWKHRAFSVCFGFLLSWTRFRHISRTRAFLPKPRVRQALFVLGENIGRFPCILVSCFSELTLLCSLQGYALTHPAVGREVCYLTKAFGIFSWKHRVFLVRFEFRVF